MVWLAYAILSALGAAGVAIFAKLGLQQIDSTLATTIRAIIMSGFLVIVSIFLGKFQNFDFSTLGTKEWLLIAAAGVSGALSWIFYFLALKLGPADGVVSVDRLSIVLVVILAAIFLGEAITPKIAFGAAMMVAGALLISL
jgi:bacterial/archaeal transporter family protein